MNNPFIVVEVYKCVEMHAGLFKAFWNGLVSIYQACILYMQYSSDVHNFIHTLVYIGHTYCEHLPCSSTDDSVQMCYFVL